MHDPVRVDCDRGENIAERHFPACEGRSADNSILGPVGFSLALPFPVFDEHLMVLFAAVRADRPTLWPAQHLELFIGFIFGRAEHLLQGERAGSRKGVEMLCQDI